MNDADNLAMLGRVMGGLVVVLVLIGLAARVARRARGQKGTSGLRVIDRIGLTREANLTVVEVANRVLLLGVTAQGVTMLADLDAAAARDPGQGFGATGSAGVPERDPAPDPNQDDDSERAVWAARVQTLANPGSAKDRVPADSEPRSQRRPVPSGVALEEYPDLASALRAAGRTAGSSPATAASQAITAASAATAAAPNPRAAAHWPAAAEWGAAVEWAEPAVPRTRAEARAEARARASTEAQTSTQAQPSAQDSVRSTAGPATSTSGEVDRIPPQRNAKESGGKKRVVPPPTGQASGSVLSPRTWRQGIEALRDLTVRRG